MGQQAIQVSLTAVWVLFAGPIADSITPQWWYGLGAALAGAQLVLAFFFLPETKYQRSIASFQEGEAGDDTDASSQMKRDAGVGMCTERPPLDFERYAPRTWKSDMRLWVGEPDWWKVWEVLRVCIHSVLSLLTSPISKRSLLINYTMSSKPLNSSSSPTSSGPCA
jgi:hypothetical protein